MRKILVTGAGGFVGARILDQWRGRYELCTFPHGFSADSDEAAVRALIAREKPDVIVHTAALSNTAYCASHPEESLRANVLLPEWIAKAAAETGAKLLAFSSDQVYAGVSQPGPLPETLPLCTIALALLNFSSETSPRIVICFSGCGKSEPKAHAKSRPVNPAVPGMPTCIPFFKI